MSDFTYIPSMLVAFTVTVAFMFALRPLAHRVHLVDRPGGRKFHDGEIPIIGGIAMFIGVFSGLALISGATFLIVTLLLS